MKSLTHLTPNPKCHAARHAFTLMETVIAILVLAVLLTGFLTVFTPAAQGIRRSISTQQADRLKATLERDMATLRNNESTIAIPTGFDKAFSWIKEGNAATKAIFVYQYRGDKTLAPRTDGTLVPMKNITGKPGVDYVTQTAARRVNDTLLKDDLEAIVGPLFYVIPTQLVMTNNELVLGTPGVIKNPDASPAATSSAYTDAVITFSAAFHMVPSVSIKYLEGSKFKQKFDYAASANSKVKPVFVRNLAVRR
jgi:type II secretory pathway pseudopilin PulG